jgi:hypothetical protein
MAAMSRTELADRFGVSVEMLYYFCRQASFPPSIGFEATGRRQRGRPAELWDEDAVREWIEQRRDRAREKREREQESIARYRAAEARHEAARVEARRLRAEGMAVLDIVPVVGMSVSFVRRVTADVPATPTRSLRPHPWKYTDEEIDAALEASAATTAYGYTRWRRGQPEPRPSSAAIIERHGTWAAALAATQRGRAVDQ